MPHSASRTPSSSWAFDPRQSGWAPLEDADPFVHLIGSCWGRMEAGVLRYALLTQPQHCNRAGIVHGGTLLGFLDHAVGTTAYEANGRAGQVTIDLNTHFISAVQPGEFVEAHCTVVHRARSVLFVSAQLRVGDRLVVNANGIYKVLSKRHTK